MFQKVNNITLFYEKTGHGKPIILLHGNGENHEIFDELIKRLESRHTIYAIDSRGHGKSSKVKTLDYHSMAEDIVGFIKVLSIEKPVLYGFSDGGIIGLMIASQYPDLLSKLMISGANIQPSGIKRKYLRIFKFIYYITRNSKYLLMITQPDIKDNELKKITIETLVLAGSNDMIAEEHTKHIATCIPKSTLKIIQNENHMSYVSHSPKLYEIIEPFLVT